MGDLEEVENDSEKIQFFRVGDRYQLECAAYEKAHDSLLDAAEAFAKTLPAAARTRSAVAQLMTKQPAGESL